MDDRYGDRDNDWRGREDGRHQGRGYDRDHRGGRDEDRGFMERAGEEVRSWFGGDDPDRGRERNWEGGRGMSHQGETAAGGWGNQAGESWNRERPGAPGSYGA